MNKLSAMTLLQHAEYSPDLEQSLLGCRWIMCGVGDYTVLGVDLLKDTRKYKS
jgi:hypothetical protein